MRPSKQIELGMQSLTAFSASGTGAAVVSGPAVDAVDAVALLDGRGTAETDAICLTTGLPGCATLFRGNLMTAALTIAVNKLKSNRILIMTEITSLDFVISYVNLGRRSTKIRFIRLISTDSQEHIALHIRNSFTAKLCSSKMERRTSI